MKRRDFLKYCGQTALLSLLPSCNLSFQNEIPDDIIITRIVSFDLLCLRNKFIGKNSCRDDHGQWIFERMIRMYTNFGMDGIGYCRADKATASRMVGKPIKQYFDRQNAAFQSPLGVDTMPLWDLMGKITNQPVYALLGNNGQEAIPVYDGSIYFSDLLDPYKNQWQDRIRREIDMGLEMGHRAFKVKIGRGAKWMNPSDGYRRDKQVLQIIRDHAGPEILIGVDANNGYTLSKTKRLLMDLPELNFAFMEEMFKEDIDQYIQLKQVIRAHKWSTLIADGETQQHPEQLKPFIDAQAIDILQGDMRCFGFEGILTEAAWCREKNLRVAPHNWGSLMGYFMQLHVGRAIDNFYRAEHDPLQSDVIRMPDIKITNGYTQISDTPGMGLIINEENFSQQIKPVYDLKA